MIPLNRYDRIKPYRFFIPVASFLKKFYLVSNNLEEAVNLEEKIGPDCRFTPFGQMIYQLAIDQHEHHNETREFQDHLDYESTIEISDIRGFPRFRHQSNLLMVNGLLYRQFLEVLRGSLKAGASAAGFRSWLGLTDQELTEAQITALYNQIRDGHDQTELFAGYGSQTDHSLFNTSRSIYKGLDIYL